MVKIGVLALQGSVEEHLELLEQIPEVNAFPIKKKNELNNIDGLILPGGESTTIGKLINIFNLKEPLIKLAKSGTPFWGTCAGMILLAKNIVNQNGSHLNLMDITVKRNAYGNQLASFKTEKVIPAISDKKLPLVFIRAPYIVNSGPEVEVLLKIDDNIVAAEEKNLLVTSFHPELDEDSTIHRYFVNKVKENLN